MSIECKGKQTLMLFGATVLNIVISVVMNMLLTRNLCKIDFGNYSYIINVFTFSQTLFLFGFFHSGSRLIALSNSEEEIHRYYGIELIILFFLYILMSISIFFFSFCNDSVDNSIIFLSILSVLPLGWVYLLTNYYEILFQGSNDIKRLALVRCLPRIVFLLLLLVCVYFLKYLNLKYTVFLYFSSYAIVYIYILWNIKPLFTDLIITFKKVWKANSEFGFNIYLGSLFSVGASQLTGLIISFLGNDNIEVGYFNIANQICLPLTLVPNIISTVYFKEFAMSKVVNNSLFKLILFISFTAFACLFFFSKKLIVFMYGVEYSAAAEILVFLSIGALLYGIADFFSRFLFANGKGKELRNSALIIGVSLSIMNFIFIKYFDAVGAAYARIFSGCVYVILMYYYYKKIINEY